MNGFLKHYSVFLLVVNLLVNKAGFADVKHIDIAPIADETIDLITTSYADTKNDPVTQLFQRQVVQAVSLLKEIENANTDDVAATKIQLLKGIVHSFEMLQKDIVNNVYTTTSDNYKRRLDTRFARAISALNSIISEPNNKENIQAAKILFFKIKSGQLIAKSDHKSGTFLLNGKAHAFFDGEKPISSKKVVPLTEATPNYKKVQPISITDPSRKAPLPAYTESPVAPHNIYASNDIFLAAAPITPAEASTCNYDSSDLAENTEVKLSTEIANLAQELNYSPAKILAYVTNNIDFEPYYGSLKGSQGALISGAGNATDQASLLIALLRASNIPSRYVKGTVEFVDDQRLLDWIGAKTQVAVEKILNVGRVPVTRSGTTVSFTHVWVEACIPYNNYRGLALDNSGHRWIPLDASFKNKSYQQGIQIGVDFDYQTYMATRLFELPNEYFNDQVVEYIKSQPPRFANNTLDDVGYIGTNVDYRVDILPASLPYTVQDFLSWGATGSAEASSINAEHRYTLDINIKSTDVPENNLFLQKIASHDKGDIGLNMSDILLQRVTLNFFAQAEPALEATALQEYINWQVMVQDLQPVLDFLGVSFMQLTQAFGGDATCIGDYRSELQLDGVVQPLSNITPAARCAIYFDDNYYTPGTHTIWVNGTKLTWQGDPDADPWPDEVIPSDGRILPSNTLTIAIRLDDLIGTGPGNPENINSVSYNNISSVEYHALHAYGFQASDQLLETKANQLLQEVQIQPDPDVAVAKDKLLGGYLDLVGLKYMRYITDASMDIGQLYGETGLSGNHIGVVSSRKQASYLFDLPYAVNTAGFLIDVKGGLNKSLNLETGAGSFDPFLLAGYSASAYESYIWQENARMDAVSSVRGIQFANEKGIEVLTITQANKATEIAKMTSNADGSLDYSTETVDTISALVDGGAEVTIPRSLIDYEDLGLWVGQVYISAKGQSGGVTQATFAIGPFAGGYSFNDPINTWFNPLSPISTGWDMPITLIQQTPLIAPSILSSAINFGNNKYSTIGGDPVNMVTGNMYHTEKDISLDARGLPVVFERTYNSMLSNGDNAQSTPMGYGWTHSFNHYLEFSDDDFGTTTETTDSDGLTSSVTWIDGTSARKFITVNGDVSGVATGAIFTAPEGFYFQVNRLANGKYTLREKNGTTYTFSNVPGIVGEKAILESISDRNNNTLTLTYIGNNLDRVTDDYGRYLQFAYNVNNQIDSITDWDARRYEYKYDVNDDLIEFHSPLAVAGTIQPVKYTYYDNATLDNLTHFMQSYTLPRGNGMTFDYYMNGKVFRHTNTNGESITFTYNDYRREATTLNERGFERKHFFDEKGNPVNIVKEGGGETTYTYDTLNPYNRTNQKDPMGYETTYIYDASGNVTTTANPSGGTLVNSFFDAFNQPGKVKDPNDSYTLYKYDAFGNRTEVIKLKKGYGATIDPAIYDPSTTPNEVLSWAIISYDSFGNPLVIKQVRDFITQVGPTIEYDYTDTVNNVNGLHPTIITRCGDRDGDAIINRPTECDSANLVYDALGRLTSGIDGSWYPVQFEYDDVDRIIKTTDANGNLRDIGFDDNGNSTSQTLTLDVNSVPTVLDQTTAFYDLSDRVQQSTNAGGFSSYFQYDASGNVEKVTNPDNFSVAFNYDANNEVISAYDEEGHAVSRALDITGRVRSVLDPNGNTTTFDYYDSTKDGRLKRQYDALGRYNEFDYDSNGNVVSVTTSDPASTELRITLSEYDALNRPVRIVGPVHTDSVLGQIRQVTLYRYDILGNQIEILAGYTDSAGTLPANDVVSTQEVSTYDDLGRRLTKTDALNKAWSYEYDVNSNLTKITDPESQIVERTYLYGGLLDVQTTSQFVGDPSPHIIDYNYNALGQVTDVTSPEVTYSYEYDTSHRLIKVTDSRGGNYVFYEYTPGGLLNAITDSEGNEIDYLYDPVGRLSNIWAANGDLVNFNYDAGGRLVEKWFSNGVNTRYSYNVDDSLAQLVNTASGTVISQHDYTYDSFGNRDTHGELINSLTLNYQYDYDPLNRLTAVRDADNGNSLVEGYSYDQYNNRQTTTSATGIVEYYVYDAANQLTEIRQNDASGAILFSFAYDNNGNQISKAEGGITLTLGYDALDRLISADKTSQPTETYTYDSNGNRIEKVVGSTATQYLYVGPDIHAEYSNDWSQVAAVYTHGPQLDDPLIRTDNFGVAEYYHQDGLGSVVSTTDMVGGIQATARYNAWGLTNTSTGTIPQYGYTGREPDATGLMYYRARHYDPEVGRFTQRDPKGFIDGINRYAYTINNPVNYTDPRGTSVFNNAFANSLTQSTSYFGTSTRRSFNSGSTVGLFSSGTQSLAPPLELGLGRPLDSLLRTFITPLDAIATAFEPDSSFGDVAVSLIPGNKIFKTVSNAASTGVQANKIAGDTVRDAIAARTGGVIEQNFRVTGGLRRVDVLSNRIAIESKVGRTGLTSGGSGTRQQLARDAKLLRSGQVDGVQWEFSRSGVTGKIGPTRPLRQKLEKLGIDIVE